MSFMNEPQADCIQQCSLVDAFTRQKPGLALRLLSEGLFYIRAMNVFIVFEFQISMQSVYAAFEGTAMRQCREYNSDFSWVVFYSSIGSVIGPFLASITIEDAVDGSGGKIL